MSNGIKAWSWSRYSTYKQCPRKIKLTAIDKMKEPGSKAMDRGAELHDLIANYIKGGIKTYPPELGKWLKPMLDMLKKQYKKKNNGMTVEDDWAFNKKWERCRWDDWNHCWVRLKLDCAHPVKKTLIVTDWKSGKARPDDKVNYTEQLGLYALAALLLHPEVEVVYPRLVFIDAEEIFPNVQEDLSFTQEDVPALKKLWEKRVVPIFQDEIFAPRPTRLCAWCWFGQAKKAEGGPGACEF